MLKVLAVFILALSGSAKAQDCPSSAPNASLAPIGLHARVAGIVALFQRVRPGRGARFGLACSAWFVTPTRILTARHCIQPAREWGTVRNYHINVYSPLSVGSIGTARVIWRNHQDAALLAFTPVPGFSLPPSPPVLSPDFRAASEHYRRSFILFGQRDSARQWSWFRSRRCAVWTDGTGPNLFWDHTCPSDAETSGAPVLASTPSGLLLLGLQSEQPPPPIATFRIPRPIVRRGPWMTPIY